MKTLVLSALSLCALAVSGCGQSLPPEERGTIVVPPTPQASGAGAPLVAPTHPYETSQATQQKQEQSGYFSAAGQPLVQETSSSGAPARFVDRDSMRQVLVASNPAVYSNTNFTTRPNLYEDPASFRAWVASQAAAQAASGASTPPTEASATREHNVFFDWDRAKLTSGGSAIVDQVASELRQDPNAQIALVGKADRSGSEAHNMGLSQRRAERVRDRLVAAGIPAERIETRWVGEHEPPVPTANGVREPRNRVVELTTTMAMSGSSRPKNPVVLPREVLFTSTETFPPGANGQELPGAVGSGSVGGMAGSD